MGIIMTNFKIAQPIKYIKYWKRIHNTSDSIIIRKTDNGFEAEIKDLDLSFLKEENNG